MNPSPINCSRETSHTERRRRRMHQRKGEIEIELHLLRAGALEVNCLCDLTANNVDRIIQQSLARHQHEMRYLKSIDRLEIANSQLQRQARIDGLTGIPNRRAFDELIRSNGDARFGPSNGYRSRSSTLITSSNTTIRLAISKATGA